MEKAQKKIDLGKTLETARELLGSVRFMFFETLLALLVAAFRSEVVGAVLFVALISLKLVVCEDILATTLPFLLVSAFLTSCYDSFNTFIVFLPAAPVVVFCVLFHFIVYKKPFLGGESADGIGLVAIAVTLGGIGGFTFMEYARGAFYLFGLGLGLLVAYFLMKSQFSVRYGYDMRERFALVMTLFGVLCTCMVLFGYLRNLFSLPNGAYSYGVSPNNISTMLMFAMPFPMYLGRKHKWATALVAAFFAGICGTHSRGGFLMGGAELIVCAVLWLKEGKWTKKRVLGVVLAGVATLAVAGAAIWETLFERLLGSSLTEEVRFTMLKEGFLNFADRPLFGTGILDDSIAYGEMNKKGTMTWYHMFIPQVVGSMGALGVFAYTMQALGRYDLVMKSRSPWSVCLGVSYLGLFLMSQVNPGEFCPIPFGLLAVLLFILQERRLSEQTLPIASSFWRGAEKGFYEIERVDGK